LQVTNAVHQADHEGKLHDAVQRNGRNHAIRDAGFGTFDFVAWKNISLMN